MTVAATPASPSVITITKSGKPSAAPTVIIYEDIYFDCDQYGHCKPTATKFSGPTTISQVSSKKSRSSKKGIKTATTPPVKAPVAMTTPCE